MQTSVETFAYRSGNLYFPQLFVELLFGTYHMPPDLLAYPSFPPHVNLVW